MNRIERMLQELCPEGVEYRKLGEVCEFQRGNTITAKDAVDGNIPVIAGGQKPAYFHNVANREGKTVVIAGSGAYAGFVTYWEIPIFVSDAFSVNPNSSLDTKYLYYYLKNIQEKIHATKKGSGVPHVHGSSIAKFEIPLPPLPIQEEIVRILDRFTGLTAELQAELQARQEQYEHYRNRLLTFDENDENIRWMRMSEIAEISTGNSNRQDAVTEGIYPFFVRSKNVYSSDTYEFDEEAVIIPGEGGIGDIFHYIHGKYALHQRVYRIHLLTDKVDTRFLYYFMSSHFKGFIMKKAVSATVTSIRKPMIEKFEVPIPPLREQKRIVSILDKFETLVCDLSQGLPAEIAAVQEQYEYYRNKLLTFNHIESN